ncbi:MAG: hypothetical protein M3279_01320 [Actinomycetota bacterium]|nr:hypothetical protein [Actinomycetota bacterium]
MGERRGSGRGILARALALATAGIAVVALLAPGRAWGQVVPASQTVVAGDTAATTVTGIACPWPVLPAFVGYNRDPECAAGVPSYELTFFVVAEAPAGYTSSIPIHDCGVSQPPDCSATGHTFALMVAAAATPSPVPASPSVPGGPVPFPHVPVDLDPKTEEQQILNGWLESLRSAIVKQELTVSAIDELPELREGESDVMTFELPDTLLKRVADNALGEREDEVQTTITATLRGTGFDDTPLVEETQRVEADAGARWEWSVQPVGSGSAHITLSLAVTSTLDSTVWPEPFPPASRTLPVQANWSHKVGSFLAESWQWLLGLIVPTAAAFVTGRKTDPARRRERERESAGGTPAATT